MIVTKSLGNNAALARDSQGSEVVLVGTGVGFPKMPYVLTDLSKVQRTFYGCDQRALAFVSSISEKTLLASAEIIDIAEERLGISLNPNAAFTLADHIEFAFERIASNTPIETPLSYDVLHLYATEADIAAQAIEIVEHHTGHHLPDSEVASIALHILASEAENSNVDAAMEYAEIAKNVIAIIERWRDVEIDANAFTTSRFLMHLRYLIERLKSGTSEEAGSAIPLDLVREACPEACACAETIALRLHEEKNWECTDSEIAFLAMHINRLHGREQWKRG